MAIGTSKRQDLIVTAEFEGSRIDLYLTRVLPQLTRSQVQRLIQKEQITLREQLCRAKDVVRAGDVVSISYEVEGVSEIEAQDKAAPQLNIVYEDEALLIVDKPAGLIVHPGAGQTRGTLWEGLKAYLGERHFESDEFLGMQRPGIVHRLDKDTSGLLVCAKSARAHKHLGEQFAKKTNLREYVALLDGFMTHSQIIHASYLARDPKYRKRFKSYTQDEVQQLTASGVDAGDGFRWAKSEFFRRKTYGKRLSLVTVRLYTGRTHQIRLHARDLRMAVVGDLTYHRPAQLPIYFPEVIRDMVSRVSRQMLHARVLGFTHPYSGQKVAFESALPNDFRDLIMALDNASIVTSD